MTELLSKRGGGQKKKKKKKKKQQKNTMSKLVKGVCIYAHINCKSQGLAPGEGQIKIDPPSQLASQGLVLKQDNDPKYTSKPSVSTDVLASAIRT